MKTRVILLGLLALTVSVLTACKEDATQDAGIVDVKSAFTNDYFTIPTFTTTAADLTESDSLGLLLMREEELLAHDVYVYFFNKYGLAIFERISESESRHAEAVLLLLEHFGMSDPATGELGVYTNEELQTLYNNLITMGDESVIAALTVGGLIEETDIQDLDELINATENSDVINVYTNLLNGSYNHLKGFVRNLNAYGETYVPSILDQELYETILAMTNGNGQQSRGNSSGYMGSNGKQGGKHGNGNGGNH